MITTPRGPFPFTVDIGRPVILSEQAVKRWKQIHNWIKTSTVPVAVNKTFYLVDRYITSDQFYQGSRNQYSFAFKTTEDKDAFIQAVNQAVKDYPIIIG